MLDKLDSVEDAHLEKILTHLHREAMGHVFTSTLPTATTVPIGKTVIYDDTTLGEIRVYLKTASNNLIYYRLNSSGEVVVDGEINIGSHFKANDSDGMWLGAALFGDAPFSVSLAGALIASSATITGNITAETGSIGGFTIGATSLTAGTGATSVGLAPGTYPFYAGDATAADAPFRVNTSGVVTCTNLQASGGTIGGWDLTADTIESSGNGIVLTDSTSRIDVGTGATTVQIDGVNTRIRSSDYVSGALGAGWQIDADQAEFNNIRARGKISTAVFEKTSISSVGGNLLVSDSDILDADMTAADASTLTITGDTTFAVNDILRIKDVDNDEWLTVTNVDSAPTYTVTRDGGTSYGADANPVWKTGTAVINYGASGEGLIYMTASDINAPHIDVLTHAGSPWDTTTTNLRLGNVNGFLGAATDLYGLYIGDSDAYFKYDTTNGLEIFGDIISTSITLKDPAAPTVNYSYLDAGILKFHDVCGNVISVGDYILYATSLGRSPALKFGFVLDFKPPLYSYEGKLISK